MPSYFDLKVVRGASAGVGSAEGSWRVSAALDTPNRQRRDRIHRYGTRMLECAPPISLMTDLAAVGGVVGASCAFGHMRKANDVPGIRASDFGDPSRCRRVSRNSIYLNTCVVRELYQEELEFKDGMPFVPGTNRLGFTQLRIRPDLKR